MESRRFQNILKRIAAANNTTVEEVRNEMLAAMREVQASKDPVTQAGWARIPRKGAELTLEEFVDYLASELQNFQ